MAEAIRAQYVSKVTGKRVLVTGGVGYIGSHTVIELVNAGAIVTVIDKSPHTPTARAPSPFPPSLCTSTSAPQSPVPLLTPALPPLLSV